MLMVANKSILRTAQMLRAAVAGYFARKYNMCIFHPHRGNE